eukprot:363516-Chlamydomonas_euryale.AAC.5
MAGDSLAISSEGDSLFDEGNASAEFDSRGGGAGRGPAGKPASHVTRPAASPPGGSGGDGSFDEADIDDLFNEEDEDSGGGGGGSKPEGALDVFMRPPGGLGMRLLRWDASSVSPAKPCQVSPSMHMHAQHASLERITCSWFWTGLNLRVSILFAIHMLNASALLHLLNCIRSPATDTCFVPWLQHWRLCMCERMCVRACMCLYICMCMRVCMCVCMCMCM